MQPPLAARPSGLLVFTPRFKAREEIVTLPDGRRVRVTTDDSGTTRQIEEDEALHAIVRPKVVRFAFRSQRP